MNERSAAVEQAKPFVDALIDEDVDKLAMVVESFYKAQMVILDHAKNVR